MRLLAEEGRRDRAAREGRPDSDLRNASAEDEVIAKCEWARLGESERHLRDVAEVVAVQGEALDAIRIDRWAEEVDVRREWQRARNLARENEGRG